MQTFPLPEEGGAIQLTASRPDEQYIVKIEPGAWMLVVFGSTKVMPQKATSQAIRCVPKPFEFKHYRPDGGKYRTERQGYEYLFAVRKQDLKLLDEATYSYPVLVLPGGEQIKTNTSGGSLSSPPYGWCDWLPNVAHSCIDHPMAVWQALNAVAVKSGSPYDTWLTREERQVQFFAEYQGRWMAIAASCSDTHPNIVEVTCTIDARRESDALRRTYLVPREQYVLGDVPWLLPERHDFAELVVY